MLSFWRNIHLQTIVWIDKKELLGGETFWETIELAVKFLLAYSENICHQESNEIKAGIKKVIHFAKKVMTNESLSDFFIILHMDNSGYNLFPGAKDLNQIPFNENWAEGLTVLQRKFNRDNVPKTNLHELDDAANSLIEMKRCSHYTSYSKY